MASSSSAPQGFSMVSMTGRTDIGFALALIAVLILLFMPVSTILLDMSLALSILFSIMILFTALFIERPLEFSSFPTVLLVSTMVRLALDVAATRVILSHGHEGAHSAGRVIEAFGRFLMGGNFVIGIIVFTILIIVNFVVITKGSGRIAEVSARFSLDAMPGKQMAVDADLSAGLINEAEAKRRRKLLEDESNFYGSMDGAAKFVRGDAIAGLLITFINIIGGLIIGVGQMDLSFTEALTTYTILTVGDGLVSQVPALIVSTAAGMLVSKAGVEGSADKALVSQLSSNPTVLGLSAFLMMVMALTPGLPGLPFFVLALGCGFGAWRVTQAQIKAKEQEAANELEAAAAKEEVAIGEEPKIIPGHIDHLRIEIGYGLLTILNGDKGIRLTDQIKSLRKQLAQEVGFVLPSVRIQDNIQIGGMSYLIRVKELEAGRGELRPDHYLVMNPSGDDIRVDGETTLEPTFGLPARWITEDKRLEAERLGYTVVDAATVLTTHLTEIVKDNLAELLTYVETQKMLDELGDTYKKLLNDLIPAQISLGGIQRILQNLVSERVSIRDLATIIEAISEGCGYSRNVSVITEHVRQRLSRQITHSNLDENYTLKIVPLTVKWDQAMQDSLVGEGEIRQLALSPSQIQEFIADFKTTFDRIAMSGEQAVLVVNPTLRPYVRSIVARVRPSIMVLGQNEIHPSAQIQNVGQV